MSNLKSKCQSVGTYNLSRSIPTNRDQIAIRNKKKKKGEKSHAVSGYCDLFAIHLRQSPIHRGSTCTTPSSSEEKPKKRRTRSSTASTLPQCNTWKQPKQKKTKRDSHSIVLASWYLNLVLQGYAYSFIPPSCFSFVVTEFHWDWWLLFPLFLVKTRLLRSNFHQYLAVIDALLAYIRCYWLPSCIRFLKLDELLQISSIWTRHLTIFMNILLRIWLFGVFIAWIHYR